MTTPTITLYPDTLPAKGQANAAFDVNVDDFLTWLTLTNGPELAAMITYTDNVASTVLATALAGNLPALTGKAGNYIRANAAEDGGEFRTPTEVLADIGATAALALKAPIANPTFTGVPAVPTATPGTNTTQAASTAFVIANAPSSPVKAWLSFNGTGSVSIYDSFNVSSITDLGTGSYIVNFTTDLDNINYAVTTACRSLNPNEACFANIHETGGVAHVDRAPLVGSFAISVTDRNNNPRDSEIISAAVFG
jgi:hypothetical protein